jgi:RNA polymerase sigma-54 factor
MTPQLQQAIKLLTLSNLEIEAFIGEALETNPLLEAGEISVERGATADEVREDAPDDPTADQLIERGRGEADAPLDIDPETLDRDRDTGDWSAQPSAGMADEDGPDISERGDDEPTLAEHLDAQVGAASPDDRTEFVARHLIGLLDEAGYLTVPLREVADDLGIALAEAEQALTVVQSLDPTGVGARTLSECLALQAKEADRYDPCMERLIGNLDLVARGEFARLKRMCDVDDEDFADMLNELRGYDPKPGLKFGGGEREPVVPDILITAGPKESWNVAVNEATLPRLIVNRRYYVELRNGCHDKAAKSWLGEKLADANWLIKALDEAQFTIL